VSPERRIATFDNDGTLMTEKPVYTQLYFIMDRIQTLAPQHPEWEKEEIFRSLPAGAAEMIASMGKKGILELLAKTHAGMTTDEFATIVSDWIFTHEHPTLKRPYVDTAYQPMLELLAYLRSRGFRTFVVTGASQEFVRPFAEKVYGIPPHQVIGSSVKTEFKIVNTVPVLVRQPDLFLFTKMGGKVVGIQKFIGERPIAAFGNSHGDVEMLQWTTAGDGLRFGLLVHHTDGTRAAAYDTGLGKALDVAEQKGWTVVDMKTDWKTIFPRER
jgi:phosphoglycolate phosphatase-like HAD superfamily hydrolase